MTPATLNGHASPRGSGIRRGAMWVLASGVMLFAALQSYSHIYDLGHAHGGGWTAWLLPLSVDMLIIAGELMLLHEADAKGRRFALGWVLVWSGILATLAANVTYGWQHGRYLGAVIWGWPAYSFILAAAGMVAVVKRGTVSHDTPEPVTVPSVTLNGNNGGNPMTHAPTVAELAASQGVSVSTYYRRRANGTAGEETA